MKKLNAWLYNNSVRHLKIILVFFIAMSALNGYWLHEAYQAKELWETAVKAFNFGLFVTSTFYYTVVIINMVAIEKSHNREKLLMIHNLELMETNLALQQELHEANSNGC